jgi:N-succinyldiaminopimelate aminotransferase
VLARLLACCQGRDDIVPFHVGNTHLSPPARARLEALRSAEGDSSLYTYAGPRGEPALVEAVADKLRRRNQLVGATADNIQITCGATHALSLALRSVLDPGDEVLVLAPYWPMIRGVAASVGVGLVEVPSIAKLRGGVVPEAMRAAVVERLRACATPKSAAIYLSNPNNPDGQVYTRAELEGIAEVAAELGLWIIADEVYEAFTFDGRPHLSIASLPGAAERTLTAYSFSKSYAQAGLRVGYLAGPEGVIAAARNFVHHGVYNVPRAMQRAALAALEHGDEFLAEARAGYQRARDVAAAKLSLDVHAPEGGTYLFLDLRGVMRPGEIDALPLLERLARAGVLLVPGYAFGRDYVTFARLCFSAVAPSALEAGIERLNRVLESGG